MKKTLFGLIVCTLLLIITLSACAINRFPIGVFLNIALDEYVLELKGDSTWTSYVYGEMIESGTYSVQGNEFTLWMNGVDDAADASSFVYEWSYEEDILTLKLCSENSYPEQFRVIDAKAFAKNQ